MTATNHLAVAAYLRAVDQRLQTRAAAAVAALPDDPKYDRAMFAIEHGATAASEKIAAVLELLSADEQAQTPRQEFPVARTVARFAGHDGAATARAKVDRFLGGVDNSTGL